MKKFIVRFLFFINLPIYVFCIVKERANFIDDIYNNSKYFFIHPKDFDKGNLTDEQIEFSIKWIENFMSLIKKKTFRI